MSQRKHKPSTNDAEHVIATVLALVFGMLDTVYLKHELDARRVCRSWSRVRSRRSFFLAPVHGSDCTDPAKVSKVVKRYYRESRYVFSMCEPKALVVLTLRLSASNVGVWTGTSLMACVNLKTVTLEIDFTDCGDYDFSLQCLPTIELFTVNQTPTFRIRCFPH